MLKKAYSVETKLACIEMKKAGKSNKVITVKVLEELSEVEQLRLQVQLLKKYRSLVRQSQRVSGSVLFRRQTLNFLLLESKRQKT
ncbi:hypothetical protein HMPREF9682_00172 [Streptococcus intermedius F0395]|nr:hypothetical protein HMPREF9682_00172 [Streptococcus intermedius F0395]